MTEDQISIKLSQAGMHEVDVAIANLTMKPHPVLNDFESKGDKKSNPKRQIILRLIEL